MATLRLVLAALWTCSALAFVSSPSRSSWHPSFRHQSSTLTMSTSDLPTIDINDVFLQDSPDSEKKSEQFNWFKSWYPMIPVEYLDPEIPHHFELLGMDLVVWNDGELSKDFQPKRLLKNKKRVGGQWRAFIDECPHRKVPLSEGRVESDGSLLCSYHGWRFEGDGSLVDVPQLDSKKTLERIASNPKSKCNSFPTQVVDGVLWVWAETGDDARLEAALTPVPNYKLPEGVDPDRVWYGPWNSRELPYGHDFFIENVVDPAHVGVSHHNVVGSRYDDQRLNVRLVNQVSKSGFAFQSSREDAAPSNVTFTAPSSVAIAAPFGDEGAFQVLELYSSPSRPGFSNHVGRMVVVKGRTGGMPKLLKQFTLPFPKWINHIMSSFFLNQDALFLHHQERYMAKTGQYSSLRNDADHVEPYLYANTTLPVSSDRGVLAFRDWLRTRAGGRIPYRNNPTMPPADNNAVFDVWNQHTKKCQICQKALKNLKRIRFGGFATAACLAALRPGSKALSLSIALTAAGMGLLLNKLIAMFYRYEYSHAHND